MSEYQDGLAWLAPAKLNLFLHIIGRRDDGYHNLQTVFQYVDIYDELFFKLTTDGKIHRVQYTHDDSDQVIADEDDLVVRAAKLLQQQAGIIAGVEISLHKRIPIGAGLGGGSSDAATTLLVLNRLWQVGFEYDSLVKLGLSLGADVPFFIYGKAAFAAGVGEQFTAIEPATPYYLIVAPKCQVSTKEIFSAKSLLRNTPPITIDTFLHGEVYNNCEQVVCERYPQVAEVMDWLRAQNKPAHLTGTGACVFVPFSRMAEAERFKDTLPNGWNSFVACGLNRSPLHEQLERNNTE